MSDTLIGTLIGTVGTVVVATITWLATRGKTRTDSATTTAQLAEERRQKDIDQIISTLQEEVASLRVVVKAHEETIQALRTQNYDVFGEKQQLAQRLGEQDRELARLRMRVAELEGRSSC
jgi:chromosome segregation ATPase